MANEKRLIDANALSESFEKAAYKCEYIEDMVFHLDYILDEITGADEVDAVEVVHGRWIDAYGIRKSKCENCGVAFCRVMEDCYYCPNCGAKMMGGDGNG